MTVIENGYEVHEVTPEETAAALDAALARLRSPGPPEAIKAATNWPTNGDMIADVARLGYLQPDWAVLDTSHGLGTFWTRWRPETPLTACDLNQDKSPWGVSVDFRSMPFGDAEFDAVVLDGPYRLNGTPDATFDERYGTDEVSTWQDRMQLIRDGITECVRVLKPKGILLVKCADQVCSGKVRWQTIDFTLHAEKHGCELVDSLLFLGGRPQPAGRRQIHARRNYSTLLIFRKRTNA
jgi:SAM-dependent methyltransferase